MNPLRRPAVFGLLALAVALAVAACGGGPVATAATTPAPVPGAPDRPTEPTQDATLVRVVDGDTIRVLVGGVEERVRYIGIDTPELNTTSPATPDPYAQAATDANARLLAAGRLILETDIRTATATAGSCGTSGSSATGRGRSSTSPSSRRGTPGCPPTRPT